MQSRRDFLAQASAVGIVTTLPAGSIHAATGSAIGLRKRPRIKSAIRREETLLRLGGSGDCFCMTWAKNDQQFMCVNDGAGWFENPKGFYNTRLWAMSGGPQDARFLDVPNYPDLISSEDDPAQKGRYYAFGILSLDGFLYQFLSTLNHPPMAADGSASDAVWAGDKLIYSADNGYTWRNQDGSTPVVWESWQDRTRRNMVFFEEPQNAFSLVSVLQMGRNYQDNRDGFAYVYAPNGNADGTANELVMCRVPKAQILSRGSYEYFAGLRPDGGATWTKDIGSRAVVHTFPRGWVNRTYFPWTWLPSVTYNSPLGLYMMANWGTGTAADGLWFGKPSYLGLWIASNPWGPWNQIYEEAPWTPNNESAARPYAPQISPKWIAKDGRSFWLVWTDYQQKLSEEEFARRSKKIERMTHDRQRREELKLSRQNMPYYAFNAQRVDLMIE